MPNKKKLTHQERLFALEFMQDLDAEAAAIRAGYAETTARKKAHTWVGKSRQNSPKPWVWDHVHELMAKRAEKLTVSAEGVVVQLAGIGMIGLDDEKMLSGQVRVSDKLKAPELLGRHLGMFKDGPPVVQITLAEVLDMLDGKKGTEYA